MTNQELKQLDGEFREALFAIEREARKVVGRPFVRFLEMINNPKLGAVGTAKKLINEGSIHDGFVNLMLAGHKDLTMEYLVATEQRFWPLFTKEQIKRARLLFDLA
jgi:hypothetical protein